MAGVETYTDVAMPEDIARQWPDGRDAPQLILDVAAYMKPKQWRSLGAVRVFGRRMEDFWIENGADLWRDFGVFLVLPDGSRVAQWFREGQSGEPPIVLIGSEGEQEVLAPNLESFLASWAFGEFNAEGALVVKSNGVEVPAGLPSDLIRGDDEDEDGVPNGRPEFAAFLTKRLGRDLNGFVAPKPDDAPLKVFFTEWGERARKDIAANENLRAIAKVLDAHVPRGKEVWERAMFTVNAIGDRIEISKRPPGSPPIKEEAALVPLVRAEREARAKGVHSVRGLWHVAEIMLYPDGMCQIASGWDQKPEFKKGGPPSAKELAAEQASFPKSERWIESWMRELK